MKWSWFGRAAMALVSALGLGLGMTACGGHTVAYMWVLGQQYNQITGFKVDNDTGNLTAIQNSPFAANGSMPVYLVVKPGGRYLYVVNQGATSTPTQNSSDSGIAVFSVGGDGALTFQQSYPTQGFMHLWAQFDSTGNYLYVLDKYAPTGTGGAITAFAADPNTGRLTLQTQTAAAPSGQVAPTFVPVGQDPVNMASSGGCLFTLNGGDAANNVPPTVTPYLSSSGQLTTTTNGNLTLTAVNPTNINGNSSYMVVTDAGAGNTATGFTSSGAIFPYTVSASCGLTTFTGGGQGVPNTPNATSTLTSATDPTYSLFDTSGKYLFVLNSSNASTNPDNPYSQISAYDIVTTPVSELSVVPGEPFPVGSGPVCMVEDPTQRYIYVSNQGGTVTGFDFTSTEGTLEDLERGSSFTINDNHVGCLALSGSVD